MVMRMPDSFFTNRQRMTRLMTVPKEETGTKRKRCEIVFSARKRPKSKSNNDESNSDDQQSRILILENEIVASRKHYNNIAKLITIASDPHENEETSLVAAVSLCRVFVRLMAEGKLVKRKNEDVVVDWLRERLKEYMEVLLSMLSRKEAALTALALALRVLKAEGQRLGDKDGYKFPCHPLGRIVRALAERDVDERARKEFVQEFVKVYDDIRFYTFQAIRDIMAQTPNEADKESIHANLFEILVAVETVPESSEDLQNFYMNPPKQSHALHSLSKHKKQAQEAWLALMAKGLSKQQRKIMLENVSSSIAPWFSKPELLMDFLTDCYNAGGSTSLLALSGVFYLIQQRNLDYPAFYKKLYSLLDAAVLHSRHRSPFFRLLDTFLASSHLPAALVASFIKRLARLALNAPPTAIVAIVPWFYNLFKKHPLCTFMMQRVPRDPDERARFEADGFEDPFLSDAEDPLETRAIDSCLWEVVQLQAHWHPNVATIAKIISEQFTRQFYNLEDFLDHSYASLLKAEMNKEIKKAPVVEFMIPKKILLPHDSGAEEQDSLLMNLWDFGS